jgi:hypothetical protein
LIHRLGVEVPLDQVRDRSAALSGRVSERRLRFGDRPCKPWRAIDAATAFFDTRQPAATRSPHTRGDP